MTISIESQCLVMPDADGPVVMGQEADGGVPVFL